jgi:benzoylformate decarboxylase
MTTTAAAVLEVLRRAGVRHLFGNPGTTELALVDALPASGLQYVLALQEATATAAADGYAQASGGPGVVNLHVLPGLANGLAIVHNAQRARSPLVVTAGQQDTRLLLDEPILSGDLVRLAEPLTKWAYEVRRAAEAPAAVRRALKVALTPPTGPVFLSLPMDLMTEAAAEEAPAPPTVPARAQPDPAAIARAAGHLLQARAPLIVAGDGVARAGAVADLVTLAEALGAPVHGEPIFRRLDFPADHPLWRGGLYPGPGPVRRALERADVVLLVGATVFTWFLHAPGDAFPPGLTTIQLDDDPWELARAYPVTLALAGDPGGGLRALAARIAESAGDAHRAAAAARRQAAARTRAEQAARLAAAAEGERTRVPVAPGFLMHTLAGLLPDEVAIVDESASSLPHVLRHLPFRAGSDFFGSRTGTLGWGMGAAVGVQLARPGRKVVATIGDGSLMYAPQALWTAARYRLPITYVVIDNASYAILKGGMLALGLESAKRGLFDGLDLTDPEIDHVRLAASLGVRAERVEEPKALRDTLAACLAHPGPSLVSVAVDRTVEGRA